MTKPSSGRLVEGLHFGSAWILRVSRHNPPLDVSFNYPCQTGGEAAISIPVTGTGQHPFFHPPDAKSIPFPFHGSVDVQFQTLASHRRRHCLVVRAVKMLLRMFSLGVRLRKYHLMVCFAVHQDVPSDVLLNCQAKMSIRMYFDYLVVLRVASSCAAGSYHGDCDACSKSFCIQPPQRTGHIYLQYTFLQRCMVAPYNLLMSCLVKACTYRSSRMLETVSGFRVKAV